MAITIQMVGTKELFIVLILINKVCSHSSWALVDGLSNETVSRLLTNSKYRDTQHSPWIFWANAQLMTSALYFQQSSLAIGTCSNYVQ